jgi:hypothetical protein
MFDETIKLKIKGTVFYVKEAHFHQHPEVFEYLTEGLKQLVDNNAIGELQEKGVVKISLDFGRILGTSDCIETNPDDEIFYAQRRGRKTFTRFVKNKVAPDCSTLTMVLAQGNKPNRINVVTAYVGYQAEKEPLDGSIKNRDDFEKSVQFWKTHALVEKSQRIYNNTITAECPWDTFDNRPNIVLGNNNNVSDIIAQLRAKSVKNDISVGEKNRPDV